MGGLLEGHGQGAGDARVDVRRAGYSYIELGFGKGNAPVLVDYLRAAEEHLARRQVDDFHLEVGQLCVGRGAVAVRLRGRVDEVVEVNREVLLVCEGSAGRTLNQDVVALEPARRGSGGEEVRGAGESSLRLKHVALNIGQLNYDANQGIRGHGVVGGYAQSLVGGRANVKGGNRNVCELQVVGGRANSVDQRTTEEPGD